MNDEMSYSLLRWPEIQDYMDHPRWNECFNAQRIDETDSESYWFVPDDIVVEVEYAKFQETAEFIWDGQVFTRDIFTRPIKEGDLVLFTDDNDRLWTSTCEKAGSLPGEPSIYSGGETPGINCWIEGIKI